ncbi:MAG: ketopantoate reductase family protein [Thermodesulfobacteriota bacterium]
MKIAIVGAGAMGSLFGGLLARSGEEVWLIDIWKEHIESICTQGLIIEEKERIERISIHATTQPHTLGKADVVVYFVKTYHTEKAVIDSLILEKDDTVFLTLQNGLGNEETICKYIERKKVLLGVTGQGATLLGPGLIRHAGWGKTYIGELNGKITERVNQIAQMFSRAGIETEVTCQIHDFVWEKLFVNVGLNALAALTGLKNGQILEYPETLRLLERLVTEAVEVAKRKGVQIQGNPLDRVKAVIEATRENRCSMGQDFDRKRRTEIDALNGAVLKEAERLGLSVPYNQMITDLIKVIEKTF